MNAMKYKGYTARLDLDAEDNILTEVSRALGTEGPNTYQPEFPRASGTDNTRLRHVHV